jgi:hypothetical protein
MPSQCGKIARLLVVRASQRESLRADLDSKFSVIFHSYGQELLSIQETYQRLRENPPRARNLPPVYGAIAWARHLLNRIQEPMRHFQENKKVWVHLVDPLGCASSLGLVDGGVMRLGLTVGDGDGGCSGSGSVCDGESKRRCENASTGESVATCDRFPTAGFVSCCFLLAPDVCR